MTDNDDRSRKRALVEHVAEATAEFSAAHVHVHGCKLDPDELACPTGRTSSARTGAPGAAPRSMR